MICHTKSGHPNPIAIAHPTSIPIDFDSITLSRKTNEAASEKQRDDNRVLICLVCRSEAVAGDRDEVRAGNWVKEMLRGGRYNIWHRIGSNYTRFHAHIDGAPGAVIFMTAPWICKLSHLPSRSPSLSLARSLSVSLEYRISWHSAIVVPQLTYAMSRSQLHSASKNEYHEQLLLLLDCRLSVVCCRLSVVVVAAAIAATAATVGIIIDTSAVSATCS